MLHVVAHRGLHGLLQMLGILFFQAADWCRALGFPLERPKSMSTEGILAFIEANKK